MPEAPRLRRRRPRRRERPRRRRAAATTAASSSRRCHRFAEPAGARCPTACTGTCSRCSRRRWTALRGARAALAGVGVDAWGVDYALLDERGRVLGLPFHYRDDAHRRDGRARLRARPARRALRRRPASRRCRSTPSSSCWPTRARPRCDAAARIALVPDLLAFWLSGELANESTNASHHRPARRAQRAAGRATLIERLGLPGAPVRRAGRARHDARAAARPPRARRRAAVLAVAGARHRVGLRRRAGARRARRDPLERDLVAARARAARAGARRRARATPTSPTSAASTARRGCSRT